MNIKPTLIFQQPIFHWRVKNLSMKEGSLFCIVVMRSIKLRCFILCSWCLLKALDEEGCIGLVLWRLDLWCKSSWTLNDFSLKIKLNCSWKFWKNWIVRLMLMERSWWAGFYGIYVVRFGLRMWKIWKIQWFLSLKKFKYFFKPYIIRSSHLGQWERPH
jgi:hypothetical protein